MRNFYRAILRLYPAEYQAAFAAEMIEVFDQASTNVRTRNLLRRIWFATFELAGLMKGLVLEHAARQAARETYITARCTPRPNEELPIEIVEVQHQLERLLRSMEFAIAHHDFPNARLFSNQERVTRSLLQRLVNEHKLNNPLTQISNHWHSNECG